MNPTNLTVFITGASSGIGQACAELFAKNGARLILTARRIDKLNSFAETLRKNYSADVITFSLDVRSNEQVTKTIDQLPNEWQQIDVLINNAGLALGLEKIQNGHIEDWETMIDTNVKGLLFVSRKILPLMLKRNKGHVINLGSIAGRQVYPNGAVYCATKYAVRAINEGLKIDLLGTPIRVTSIDPGMVQTSFSEVRFKGDADKANSVYQGMTPLSGHDIADIIYFCVTRPYHVNISEVWVMPTAQASVQLVHREKE